jgi:predicted transcriptional regulator
MKVIKIGIAPQEKIRELTNVTGRKQGNLSHTLKTMSQYGLVKMEKNERSVHPIACAESYLIVA